MTETERPSRERHQADQGDDAHYGELLVRELVAEDQPGALHLLLAGRMGGRPAYQVLS